MTPSNQPHDPFEPPRPESPRDEAWWQACDDPEPMLDFLFLEPRASERKLIRFGVACVRRTQLPGDDPAIARTIAAAEQHADGAITEEQFEDLLQHPALSLRDELPDPASKPDDEPEFDRRNQAIWHLRNGGNIRYASRFAAMVLAQRAGPKGSDAYAGAYQTERAYQVRLLRDLIGSPFQHFAFDPTWLASDAAAPAVSLARLIDEQPAFGPVMPSLVDTLERAGCPDPSAIAHGREPGPHGPGCWVVDALLGRETAVAVGLLTADDWAHCDDPAPFLRLLRDRGTVAQWRRFAVACCRRIAPLIVDERSRRAVEVAARHADDRATAAELGAARDEAKAAYREAKRLEYDTEAEEGFRITPRYAAVSRDLFAAQAARSALNRDPRRPDADPGTYEHRYWKPAHEWALAAARWAVRASWSGDDDWENDEDSEASDRSPFDKVLGPFSPDHGKLIGGDVPPRLEKAAEAARLLERRAQLDLLRTIFADQLGPPGDAFAWLPRGEGRSPREWWCRLPTPAPDDRPS